MRQWIVLYIRGGRYGSVERTPTNEAEIKSQFHITNLQTDISGTVHWEIMGTKRGK